MPVVTYRMGHTTPNTHGGGRNGWPGAADTDRIGMHVLLVISEVTTIIVPNANSLHDRYLAPFRSIMWYWINSKKSVGTNIFIT
jgi:hypothetical protein